MSTAPNHALAAIQEEIQLLRRSQHALQEALATARRGRDATAPDLLAVQKRLTARTEEALPHDDGIRNRITSTMNSAFTTALHALTARWEEIIGLLEKECERIGEALNEAERRLLRREQAVSQAQQRSS